MTGRETGSLNLSVGASWFETTALAPGAVARELGPEYNVRSYIPQTRIMTFLPGAGGFKPIEGLPTFAEFFLSATIAASFASVSFFFRTVLLVVRKFNVVLPFIDFFPITLAPATGVVDEGPGVLGCEGCGRLGGGS